MVNASIPHVNEDGSPLIPSVAVTVNDRSTDRDGYGKNGLDTEIYHDGAVYHVRQHDRRSRRNSVPSLLESLSNDRRSSQLVQSPAWQVNRLIVGDLDA